MSIAQSFLAEFEQQAPITRKFLERLPEDKLTWKPHEKSMTAGQLALHIASVPGGIARFVQNNPAPAPQGFSFPQPGSREEILNKHEESAATVRQVLPQFDDAAMAETWRMAAGDREVLAAPRTAILRDLMLSHWYQHRGQFSVYLRVLDIPVPSSWGPSADELPSFMQQPE
ncbi:MAG TPA: DinB family protein, partial [Terracidiphilus sp.]